MAIAAQSEFPAIKLYTSGSTGTPKGIVLTHSNLKTEIEFSQNIYGFESEVVLQQSSLNFDISLTQIFTAIAYGGTLYVVPRSLRGDSASLTKLIALQNITFTATTPSEYLSWLVHDDLGRLQSSKWKTAVAGGEQVGRNLIHGFWALNKLGLRLFNAYGPTKVTCSSNKIELAYEEDDHSCSRIPAGFTSPNCLVYIVDKYLRPVPIGVPGEILVGGAGVASGYIDKELATENFIPALFNTADHDARGWKIMYRTGDLGRWQDDGCIVIEGRITGDSQIKLRGLRVELGDVENSILETANGTLSEAVVSRRLGTGPDTDFLVAHVVFSPGHPSDGRDRFLKTLQAHLPLPQYMIPTMIIPLEHMILNSNSKLDRRAIGDLPLPVAEDMNKNSNALTEGEVLLKRIWEEILPKEFANHGANIDQGSDFFHVDGNSMLLVNLKALIQKKFGTSLSLVQLFEASTLRDMSLRIKNSGEAQAVTPIDWEIETELSQNLLLAEASVPPRVVVLTGATGFLGRGLLRRLLENETISKIHCLAIRRPEKLLKIFSSSEKITVHKGDLRFPRLGLSDQQAANIFSEVDAIIHSGAEVSHLKTYQTLKQANFESTKELVKLNLQRRGPFHYISTAGVAIFSGREQFDEVSAASYPPPPSSLHYSSNGGYSHFHG